MYSWFQVYMLVFMYSYMLAYMCMYVCMSECMYVCQSLCLLLTEASGEKPLGAVMAVVSSLSHYRCPMLLLVNSGMQITPSHLKVCMILEGSSTMTLNWRRLLVLDKNATTYSFWQLCIKPFVPLFLWALMPSINEEKLLHLFLWQTKCIS